MIGRVHGMGKGFKGLIRYMLTGAKGMARVEDRIAWMGFVNLPTRNPEVAACMMAATADLSVSNTQTPVYHFSVSCSPDDPIDRDMLRKIAARTVRDMGLAEYEVAIFAHKDRSHAHLHFVVNRVHPERGTLWSDWRAMFRLERTLRAQEREFGLRVVPGRLAPVPEVARTRAGIEGWEHDGAAPQRPRPRLRRGDAAVVADVKKRAVPVMERARSWAELERGLAEEGLALVVKGGGFRVSDGRSDVKASEIGREFSRSHLEKRFGPYPDYRARIAVAQPAPAAPEVAPVIAPVVAEPAPQEPAAPAPATPAQPPARVVEPRPAPARPSPPRQVERPPRPVVHAATPPARPVEPAASAPRPTRPPTERETYRAVLKGFRAELAALYHDPDAARRRFAEDVYVQGADEAVRTLASAPRTYGRTRIGGTRHVAEAARWAEVYARFQQRRTRVEARAVAGLYQAAAAIDAAERTLREAERKAHDAADDRASLADRKRSPDDKVRYVMDRARQVYTDPADAIRAILRHARVHGHKETYKAIQARPEQFGKLVAREWRVLGIPVRRDTSEARSKVFYVVEGLRDAYAALDARPTPEEMARVDEAHRAAGEAVQAAARARRALPPRATAKEMEREAARVLRHVATSDPARAARLMRQLGPMLPHGTLTLARKALEGPTRRTGNSVGGMDV